MKKIFLLLMVLILPANLHAYSEQVLLGGQNVGIEAYSKGVIVVGFYKVDNRYIGSETLNVGDIILEIEGYPVNSIKEMTDIIDKNIKDGKLKIPPNVWYIGTINNDDSTFMVTDKVYDRAMPIDINDKGQPFDPIDTDPMDVNYTYLDQLFAQAMIDNAVSKDTLDKIEIMDNYVIQHFRIAFGNRIVAQMKKFVPVFVGCGGDEVEGVDYFLARKVLRKFEQLNISYIRDEIDPYIDFLNKTFGKDKMKECIEYLTRLKKLT